jgi:hypothetical protein
MTPSARGLVGLMYPRAETAEGRWLLVVLLSRPTSAL